MHFSFMNQRSTVRQHIKDYLQSNKLKPENGDSQGYLSTDQNQELVQHLTENTYHHSHEIIAYVLERYHVRTVFQA